MTSCVTHQSCTVSNRKRNRNTDIRNRTPAYREIKKYITYSSYFAKVEALEAESGLGTVEGFFKTGGGLALGVSFPALDGGSLASWS